MNFFANIGSSSARNLLQTESLLMAQIRGKAKTSRASIRNPPKKVRPKHRGCKRQDGWAVSQGTLLVTQRTTRFHPGLNVGFGINGTLFALEPGRVVVTCEKIDPLWDHSWIQRHYAGHENHTIYKKHFNVVPFEQHKRFKLIDSI